MNALNVNEIIFDQFLAVSAFPEQVLDSRSSQQQKRVLADSAPGCIQILLRIHPTFTMGNIDPDVTLGVMLQTATVLCRAEMIVEGIISQILANLTIEVR